MSKEVKVNAAGEATRTKILDVALRRMMNGHSVSMQEIAAAAGVTRQTVHFHFSSRAGLLTAAARRIDERSRVGARFAAALDAPTAREALEASLRVWFDHVPRILPIARAFQAGAERDDAAATAWWDRMDALRTVLRQVVQRLADEDELDQRWSIDDATDLLWSSNHPLIWDLLVDHRQWDPNRLVDRQIEMAQRLLICS